MLNNSDPAERVVNSLTGNKNRVSLEQFLPHDVIGQVAQDVLIDLEDVQSILVLVERLIEVEQGEEIKIPVSVYDRSYRPRDWTPQCSGRWPCTRIFIYPTRYAYSQQRPGCSCQRPGNQQYGSRITSLPTQEFLYQQPIQEFSYQQPTQLFRQAIPVQQMLTPPQHQQSFSQSQQLQANVQSPQLLVVAQPQQQTFTQPLQQQLFTQSQVFSQPQYQTIRYQPSVSVTSEIGSPQPSSVFSSPLSKNIMGSSSNTQQVFTQSQPQTVFTQSNAQQMFGQPQYQVVKHYQTVYPPETRSQYDNVLTPPLIRRLNTDNSLNSNTQQSFIYSQPQYQATKQYRPAIYPSGGEVSNDFTSMNDSNFSAQQTLTQITQKPKFVPAQQIFAQPQYQNIKQYRSVIYAPVSQQSSSEFGQSLMRRLDNSTSSQQMLAESQQHLGYGQTQQQQFYTQPQYSTVIQYQPAKYSLGARSLDNSTNSNGQQPFVEPQQQPFVTQPQYQTVKQIQPPIYSPAQTNLDNSTETTTQKAR